MTINHSKTTKVHFPNLDGLRFVAAFLVIIHHLEQVKDIKGLDNLYQFTSIKLIGKLGVILFFVLSGFLITYLLLKEREVSGTISIKNFYIRRTLRIWPLYYLLIGLAFFIIPLFPIFDLAGYTGPFSPQAFLMFLFFIPNIALLMERIPYASHTWSIGVEEQFYLMWPIILKFVKNLRLFVIGLIILYITLNSAIIPITECYIGTSDELFFLKSFLSVFNIDCMAIGALFAILLYHKHKLLRIIFNKHVQLTNTVLLISLIAAGVKFSTLTYEVYALMFAVLIVNLAANKNSIIKLENNALKYLGKISYGLYMYHPLAIGATIGVLENKNMYNPYITIAIVLLSTILMASVSYIFFEKYFIKLKSRFSNIHSG